MKKSTKVVLVLGMIAAACTLGAEAAIQLPSYAATGANLQGDLERTGGNITKIMIGVTVMVGIVGIVFAGMAFAAGDGETGKQRLKNAVIGLVVAAVATGIAALATGN